MAPTGPPSAPNHSYRSSSPPQARSSLSRLFRRSVASLCSIIDSSHASMSLEPGSSKRRHLEPGVAPGSPMNYSLPLEDSLRVQRRSSAAHLPTCSSPQAASYDLYSAESKTVPARGRALVDTQLLVAVPPGTYGRVAPHSSLASKFSIDVGAGVIDSDYRGVIYVLLVNHGENDFEVGVGDHIAQLVLERVSTPPVLEVWDLNDHPQTPSAIIANSGYLRESPMYEIEDTIPLQVSPSPPIPQVRLPVNQTLGDCDPCPETRTPTRRELQKARSPAPRPSFPTSSHPRFTSPVPWPLGIPPPPSASMSAGRR